MEGVLSLACGPFQKGLRRKCFLYKRPDRRHAHPVPGRVDTTIRRKNTTMKLLVSECNNSVRVWVVVIVAERLGTSRIRGDTMKCGYSQTVRSNYPIPVHSISYAISGQCTVFTKSNFICSYSYMLQVQKKLFFVKLLGNELL